MDRRMNTRSVFSKENKVRGNEMHEIVQNDCATAGTSTAKNGDSLPVTSPSQEKDKEWRIAYTSVSPTEENVPRKSSVKQKEKGIIMKFCVPKKVEKTSSQVTNPGSSQLKTSCDVQGPNIKRKRKLYERTLSEINNEDAVSKTLTFSNPSQKTLPVLNLEKITSVGFNKGNLVELEAASTKSSKQVSSTSQTEDIVPKESVVEKKNKMVKINLCAPPNVQKTSSQVTYPNSSPQKIPCELNLEKFEFKNSSQETVPAMNLEEVLYNEYGVVPLVVESIKSPQKPMASLHLGDKTLHNKYNVLTLQTASIKSFQKAKEENTLHNESLVVPVKAASVESSHSVFNLKEFSFWDNNKENMVPLEAPFNNSSQDQLPVLHLDESSFLGNIEENAEPPNYKSTIFSQYPWLLEPRPFETVNEIEIDFLGSLVSDSPEIVNYPDSQREIRRYKDLLGDLTIVRLIETPCGIFSEVDVYMDEKNSPNVMWCGPQKPLDEYYVLLYYHERQKLNQERSILEETPSLVRVSI